MRNVGILALATVFAFAITFTGCGEEKKAAPAAKPPEGKGGAAPAPTAPAK